MMASLRGCWKGDLGDRETESGLLGQACELTESLYQTIGQLQPQSRGSVVNLTVVE
jgi:hypothetical protein